MTNPVQGEETGSVQETGSVDGNNITMIEGAGEEGAGEENAAPEVSAQSIVADSLATEEVPLIRYNKDGTPRKKPGRRAGPRSYDAVPGAASPTVASAPAAPRTAAQKAQIKATADLTARLLLNSAVGTMVALVGPEWDFENQEEADGLREATAAYLAAKGAGELSPEMCLLLAFSGYAISRARVPNTQQKIGAFFGDCWKSIRGVFSR